MYVQDKGRNTGRRMPGMRWSVAMLGLAMASYSPTIAQSPSADVTRTIADRLRHDPVLNAPLRGSITLPETAADLSDTAPMAGTENVSIGWRSSDPAILSDRDRGKGEDIVRKGAVRRGDRDQMVRLTATITAPGAAPVTVPFDLRVPAKVTSDPKQAYLFVYFTADTIEGEKLRFATSDGNNALQWKNLNDAQPILESTMGTRGLRDPFILRSPEGDRFFLLATDLSAGRTGWGGATDHGSQYLEIWESTDLIHWGEQRHVKVNTPAAGMTWAPEAHYDPSIDAYVVYWTSTLFRDAAHKENDGNGPQILTSITRDFRHFTMPRPWFKAADLPFLVKEKGMIDSTVLKDGDYYYRFTKVSEASGCPSSDIMGQRSRSLRATTESGAWEVIDRCIGRRAGTPEVEGPSVFAANPGDTSGFRYYLWVDDYGGKGYIPLATHSLNVPIAWTYPAKFQLPVSPRHGSVLSITARERDALAARWNRALLVTSVAPTVVTLPGAQPSITLPKTVDATFADGHVAPVGITWQTPDRSRLKRIGDSVTVQGQLANSAATPATARITVGASR